jgi:hypothetical protein
VLDDPYGKKMGRLSSIPTNDHSALERLRISVVAVQMIAHHHLACARHHFRSRAVEQPGPVAIARPLEGARL